MVLHGAVYAPNVTGSQKKPPVKPDDQQLHQANTHLDAGRLDMAEEAARGFLSQAPDQAAGWALLSEICLRQGRTDDATAATARALALEPDSRHRLIQAARTYGLLGKINDARPCAHKALALGLDRASDFTTLGAVLVRCDDHGAALNCFDQALSLAPDSLEAWRGRATVLRFLGRNREAEEACNRVLAVDRHDYEILHIRSSLRKQTIADNHTAGLLSLLKSGIKDWRGAVQVAYALAKEFEDLGEYEAAFYHLQNGADIRRRHTRYDVADDVQIFAALEAAFTADAMAAAPGSGAGGEAAIFVLGMPRTGSTLTERIISSHSMVATAGELNDFAVHMVRLATQHNNGAPVLRLDLPQAALKLPLAELGQAYMASARERVSDTLYFIDKLPLNFLNIGLIHLALPQAKIVHVNRHPLDACFAMYKYLFKQAYPFSYDLVELGTYYAAYWRLMEHWRRVLPPGRIIEVSYENLVTDQEATSRRLIAALGLPWEDACLQFHKNAAAATTGSASQVRNPIYASSVGLWQRYGSKLEPLIRTLEAHGVPCGPVNKTIPTPAPD